MTKMPNGDVKRITVDRLKMEIHQDMAMAGKAAAQAAARAIQELKRENERVAVIFATGASQLATLDALIAEENVPWKEIEGFHLDEYIGISENHPASFRRYLRERLMQRVPIGKFFEIQGDAPDPEMICSQYAQRLQAAQPQLCLLGIGENGQRSGRGRHRGSSRYKDCEPGDRVQAAAGCRRLVQLPRRGAEPGDHGDYSCTDARATADCLCAGTAQSSSYAAHGGGSDLDGVPGNDSAPSSGCDGLSRPRLRG